MSEADRIFDQLFENVRPGRKSKNGPLMMTVGRNLNPADLLLLQNQGDSQARPLVRLRHTHHMLARLLAEGRKPGECSLITGYSPSRVSILQNDPAFKDLVEYYKSQVEEVFVDVHTRLAALGLSTVEELQERLDQDPESFKNEELMKLAALLLDRSGYGPKSTTHHTGAIAVLTDETIRQIKDEAAARRRGNTIQVDASRQPAISGIPRGGTPALPSPAERQDGVSRSGAILREDLREGGEEDEPDGGTSYLPVDPV